MSNHRIEEPACYAMVLPGLETVTAEEIKSRLAGEIKRTGPGLVVFRVPELDRSLLTLRTTEDVFLLAWGTDQLSYRAADLDSIRRWTDRSVAWDRLLQIHHAIRPKPKGKPTFRLVVQMDGQHGYRRVDARKALARGLAGKLPASWRHAEENASVEIWLTIQGANAVCGLRLSDRTMRHRTYKEVHRRASLRPTLAAAMVRLAGVKPGNLVLDPMCGAGTILAEVFAFGNRDVQFTICGGDLDAASLRAARVNLNRLEPPLLARWDARQLPLPDQHVDCIISNPPFGKQLGKPEEIGPLYGRLVTEFQRVLKPGGSAVLLVADVRALKEAVNTVPWKQIRQLRVRVLGQPATIFVVRSSAYVY
jgi:23S rRNA G2445 N2-methylase RlmL